MSAIPFSGAASPYVNAFNELSDGDFSLRDITAPAVAALDVLSWVGDPFGAIASAALGPLLDFLLANVAILREPMEFVTGDQAAITSRAQQWSQISQGLVNAGNNHAATGSDMPTWNQSATSDYYAHMQGINSAFNGAARQASTVSEGIEFVGMMCAGVRELIWGLIKNFITTAVGNALAALAASVVTAGGSLGAFTAWFCGKMAYVMGKISKKIAELAEACAQATSKFTKLSEAFTNAAEYLRKMSKHKFSQSGGYSSAASKRSGGQIKVKDFKKKSAHDTFQQFQDSDFGNGNRFVDGLKQRENNIPQLNDTMNKMRSEGKRYVAKPADAAAKAQDSYNDSQRQAGVPAGQPDKVNPVATP